MARKKNKHHHGRRRKMGAASGLGVTEMLAIGAGAVIGELGANTVNTFVGGNTASSSSLTAYAGPAAVILAGIFTPKLLKGKVGESLGAGMIATGFLYSAQTAGVISGVPGMAPNVIAGPRKYAYGNKPVKTISGYQTSQGNMIAGMTTKHAAVLEANM